MPISLTFQVGYILLALRNNPSGPRDECCRHKLSVIHYCVLIDSYPACNQQHLKKPCLSNVIMEQ